MSFLPRVFSPNIYPNRFKASQEPSRIGWCGLGLAAGGAGGGVRSSPAVFSSGAPGAPLVLGGAEVPQSQELRLWTGVQALKMHDEWNTPTARSICFLITTRGCPTRECPRRARRCDAQDYMWITPVLGAERGLPVAIVTNIPAVPIMVYAFLLKPTGGNEGEMPGPSDRSRDLLNRSAVIRRPEVFLGGLASPLKSKRWRKVHLILLERLRG